MSFAIHGGKSKDAVKTRREVWGVRILIPPDGALPEKTKGRSTHVCAAALLPTVPPAFVFGVGRYVVMRNAPNQLRFGYAPCACALCRCAQCGLDF